MEGVSCPICYKGYPNSQINNHVEKCLFLHSTDKTRKINVRPRSRSPTEVFPKKTKLETSKNETTAGSFSVFPPSMSEAIPLAEKMRPTTMDNYVGQNHVLGKDKMLRQLLSNKEIPSMILWGPPGCGKTSLANIICNVCKNEDSLRFVKLSATTAGIGDVKEVVKIAQNERKFNRKTVLFMDEIHRFNKLQQDTFLPHIENGTFVLLGATTENPSFSLNSALLSRCRVIVLEKLSVDDVMAILTRAAESKDICITTQPDTDKCELTKDNSFKFIINSKTLMWLAEICDGDARIALNSFQLAIQAKDVGKHFNANSVITLEDVEDGIKRSHILYDKKGEEHYNMISALHKSVRASNDDAAIYWLTRMLKGGEDPLYIARRLIRIAGEDIGLADPSALSVAVSCMEGCKHIGMPECDVLLAECAVYLARAPKSVEVYRALQKCKESIDNWKGPLPAVPLHLRNAPTKLMSQLGYGVGYNTKQKEESGLTYMPDGMENVVFLNK